MDTGSKSPSKRIALLVQYDGTFFNGFQVQDGGRTVQGEIERAVEILTKEKIRITVAGRTDSGVHALAQVVHFNSCSSISLNRLCVGLNGIMPKDISVSNAFRVPCDFHSRFSAVEREYTYRILSSPLRSPFMIYRAMWVNQPLDVDYLNEAAGYLVGEMDFASFCKKKSADEGTVRRVNSISIVREDEYLILRIRGTAFLHNMIRIIVGTLIGMYKEGRSPEYIKEILRNKDRDSSGATAPPYGLYLSRIWYNPPLEEYESAF